MKPGDVRAEDRLRAQDPEPHQRLVDAVLPRDEAEEQQGRRNEDTDRARGAPAPVAPLRDAEHEPGQACGDEHRARRIEALHVRVTALAEQQRRERECHEADGDVDEEDPLPGKGVGEHAAEEDAGRGAEAADRAPDTEGDVPLPAFGEGRHQDRERGRRDRRRAEALNRTGADQRRLRPREPAEERADREEDQAGHEDTPATEDVGGAAAEQQEASEHECVGRDHPLQIGLRESEIGLDRGKSNVHDRDVEHDHELDGTQKRQSEPLQSGGRHHCCAVLSAGYTCFVERHAFKKQVIPEDDIRVIGLVHKDDR